MITHNKAAAPKSQSAAKERVLKQASGEASLQFVDNRPEAIAQRKRQVLADDSPRSRQLTAVQTLADNRQRNNQTSSSILPDAPAQQLKSDHLGSVSKQKLPVQRARLDARTYLHGISAIILEYGRSGIKLIERKDIIHLIGAESNLLNLTQKANLRTQFNLNQAIEDQLTETAEAYQHPPLPFGGMSEEQVDSYEVQSDSLEERVKNPIGKKKSAKLSPPSSKMIASDIDSGDEEVTYHIMSSELGTTNKNNEYEEEYDTPQLFWRGDNRGPNAVFETGFTTTNERNDVTENGKNFIIWREGGATDDILSASAICLAKDIRGSAFFPLTGASTFFIYAVAKVNVVNTFKAQKAAEKFETGKSKYQRAERFKYDPEYSEVEKASAIWQFQEYAAHRVKPEEILACYSVKRRTVVPPQNGEDVAIAGIQFILKHESDAPITRKKGNKPLKTLLKSAKSVAKDYSDYYPKDDIFLSYMGMVTPTHSGDTPGKMSEAREKMTQIDPVVIDE